MLHIFVNEKAGLFIRQAGFLHLIIAHSSLHICFSEIWMPSREFRSISIKNQKYSGAKTSKNKNTTKFGRQVRNFGVSAPKIKNTPERKGKKTKILRNSRCFGEISEYRHQKSKILRSERARKQKYSEITEGVSEIAEGVSTRATEGASSRVTVKSYSKEEMGRL